MDHVEQKVKKLLMEYFSGNEIKFENNPDGRVSAIIVSDKFLDVDDQKRQQIIWNLLRKGLNKDERMRVIGFLAFTSAEYEGYLEPDS